MVCFGDALTDGCDECTGGNTGKVANYLMDECGTFCFVWLVTVSTSFKAFGIF